MVRPLVAPVRPRVISPTTGDPVTLEEAIRSLVDSNVQGIVEILGARGAGKTTALEHLAATVASPDRLVLLDEPGYSQIDSPAPGVLLIFTSCIHRDAPMQMSLSLAPWSDDDVIEYLLAEHPPQCPSVMRRVQEDSFRHALGGQPQLWRMVLDEMARDEALSEIRDALFRGVGRLVDDGDTRRIVCDFCLAILLGENASAVDCFRLLAETDCGPALLSLIHHRAVRLLFAASRLMRVLRTGRKRDLPSRRHPYDLIQEVGRLAKADERTLKRLRRFVQRDWRHVSCPITASVLHAAGATWSPKPQSFLSGAYLSGVNWRGADLSHTAFSQAQLGSAELSETNLSEADLSECNLIRASLCKANLASAWLKKAKFAGADLSSINATSAHMNRAHLVGANLERGVFVKADLSDANLSTARLCGADFSEANLTGAIIDDADFTDADFHQAVLNGLALRKALVSGACFADAQLVECDLEFLELPDADFAGADLTGSILTASAMPNAGFQHARLCQTGLADIEWPGADLRDADLRGCSFHMGSSRSGLVGSPYPGHGSRTGFYTDTYDDRYYKSPEKIRKANLTGADLRGVDVRGVDFYLVDLRGAVYHHDQARHFRRCDAILDDWGEES